MQAILQPVTGIYVSNTPAPRGWPHRWRPALASDETAVLKDFVALADSCGVPARTVVRKDALVEDVILNEIDKGKHTLLVLGSQPKDWRGSVLWQRRQVDDWAAENFHTAVVELAGIPGARSANASAASPRRFDIR